MGLDDEATRETWGHDYGFWAEKNLLSKWDKYLYDLPL